MHLAHAKSGVLAQPQCYLGAGLAIELQTWQLFRSMQRSTELKLNSRQQTRPSTSDLTTLTRRAENDDIYLASNTFELSLALAYEFIPLRLGREMPDLVI